jgi:hypothetical protein
MLYIWCYHPSRGSGVVSAGIAVLFIYCCFMMTYKGQNLQHLIKANIVFITKDDSID